MEYPYPENGLLPQRADMPETLAVRRDGSPEEQLLEVLGAVMGLVDLNRITWTALLDDEPIPPPGAHVLDQLVRMEFSGTTAAVEAELMLHPRAGTVAVMHRLPYCDVCAAEGREGVEARYDAPTGDDNDAPWGYMCADCFRRQSTGYLGSGLGQYLMRESEVPADVWKALDRARSYWRTRIH